MKQLTKLKSPHNLLKFFEVKEFSYFDQVAKIDYNLNLKQILL